MVHLNFHQIKIHKKIRDVGTHGPVGPTEFCLIRKVYTMNSHQLKMLKQKEDLKEGGRRVFQEFCESISLHGYSYLSNANSIFSRFFWFLVILVMTSSGIVLLVQNTTEYLNAGIVTTIQSSTSNLKVSIKLRQILICFPIFIHFYLSTGCSVSFNYSL